MGPAKVTVALPLPPSGRCPTMVGEDRGKKDGTKKGTKRKAKRGSKKDVPDSGRDGSLLGMMPPLLNPIDAQRCVPPPSRLGWRGQRIRKFSC